MQLLHQDIQTLNIIIYNSLTVSLQLQLLTWQHTSIVTLPTTCAIKCFFVQVDNTWLSYKHVVIIQTVVVIQTRGYHTNTWLSYKHVVVIQTRGYHTNTWLSYKHVVIIQTRGCNTKTWLSYKHVVVIQTRGYHTNAWLSYKRVVVIQTRGYHTNAWLSYKHVVIIQTRGYQINTWLSYKNVVVVKTLIFSRHKNNTFQRNIHKNWLILPAFCATQFNICNQTADSYVVDAILPPPRG